MRGLIRHIPEEDDSVLIISDNDDYDEADEPDNPDEWRDCADDELDEDHRDDSVG